METYLVPFVAFLTVVALWIFLAWDVSWDSEREKKWFKVVHPLILAVGIPLCIFWAGYIWNNTQRRAQHHLETARNYEKDQNSPKMLEYALHAYDADRTLPAAISYLGYVYLLQETREAHLRGRDILISNSNRLDATGKATLGTIEHKLGNHQQSFQWLNPLDLAAVSENMLPWAAIALTASAFETLPYDKAVLRMRDALVVIDRRIGLYDVRIAPGTTEANVTMSPYRWYRLLMTKFHVGRIWLDKARRRGATQQMSDAIKLATEGMSILLGLIPKTQILEYLALFNHVLTEYPGFVKRNENLLLANVDQYINKLAGAKQPSYVIEITKLGLLRNCLIDLYSIKEKKQSVQIGEDLDFMVGKVVADDSSVHTLVISKNFALTEPLRPSENELPAKKIEFKRSIKLTKGRVVDRSEVFTFEVIARDPSGNQTTAIFCPNFFVE